MKPQPGPSIDRVAFEKMRRIAPSLRAARSENDVEWRAQLLPEELSFKLTNRCDLRCTHCFQWNEGGYHHQLPELEKRGDLALGVIARTLEATKTLKSNVYLWGGEPLVYSEWDGLMNLLAHDPRWTTLCTNGTQIQKRIESLNRISSHLEMSISLDGFPPEHDLLRGSGSYRRAIEGLRLLLDEKRAGHYLGEVTVNFVVSDAMVDQIFSFAESLDREGIDTLYISFPWHISSETAAKMDRYFNKWFAWQSGYKKPSWYSYGFHIGLEKVDALNAEIARLNAAQWRMKIRYNPQLEPHEIAPFLAGSDAPAQGKTRCNALRSRLDVSPNGDVISCKFFPEFRIGNLHQTDLTQVWHSPRFNEVRRTVASCGLMPVCAKCNLLYSRGS